MARLDFAISYLAISICLVFRSMSKTYYIPESNVIHSYLTVHAHVIVSTRLWSRRRAHDFTCCYGKLVHLISASAVVDLEPTCVGIGTFLRTTIILP